MILHVGFNFLVYICQALFVANNITFLHQNMFEVQLYTSRLLYDIHGVLYCLTFHRNNKGHKNKCIFLQLFELLVMAYM